MGDDGSTDRVAENQNHDGIPINIRCSNASKFVVKDVDLSGTVELLKTKIEKECDIPANQQRLIYKGRILKDNETLMNHGVEKDCTVHLVRGFPAPATTPAVGGTALNSGSMDGNDSTNAGSVVSNGPSSMGFGFGPLPFSLQGSNVTNLNGNLLGPGFPDFEQIQQQLSQNPNIMREIMNMPLIQNLVNNPEIMRNLIMNNPQMREIIDRNPELAHVLNDPSTLRQTLEAARNPELMREMIRNTDRAMSNIESSPEGFNMLRRMYETVQEPFLNASTISGNTSGDATRPFAAVLGSQAASQPGNGSLDQSTESETTAESNVPNTNPLPNPWASDAAGNTQSGTTRPNLTQENRPVPAGGAGIPAVADLERALGAFPDAANLVQMMQNPAIAQIMQSFNQQSIMSQFNQQQRASDGQGDTTTGLPNLGLDMLMNMFGGLGAGSLTVPNRPNAPPEELYANQLTQLQEMGFCDTQENIRALVATSGNVNAAVERLLGNPAP